MVVASSLHFRTRRG